MLHEIATAMAEPKEIPVDVDVDVELIVLSFYNSYSSHPNPD